MTMTTVTTDFDEVCVVCNSTKFFYSEMITGGWFCEECGAPSAKTQELLDREEPGNW